MKPWLFDILIKVRRKRSDCVTTDVIARLVRAPQYASALVLRGAHMANALQYSILGFRGG